MKGTIREFELRSTSILNDQATSLSQDNVMKGTNTRMCDALTYLVRLHTRIPFFKVYTSTTALLVMSMILSMYIVHTFLMKTRPLDLSYSVKVDYRVYYTTICNYTSVSRLI